MNVDIILVSQLLQGEQMVYILIIFYVFIASYCSRKSIQFRQNCIVSGGYSPETVLSAMREAQAKRGGSDQCEICSQAKLAW